MELADLFRCRLPWCVDVHIFMQTITEDQFICQRQTEGLHGMKRLYRGQWRKPAHSRRACTNAYTIMIQANIFRMIICNLSVEVVLQEKSAITRSAPMSKYQQPDDRLFAELDCWFVDHRRKHYRRTSDHNTMFAPLHSRSAAGGGTRIFGCRYVAIG